MISDGKNELPDKTNNNRNLRRRQHDRQSEYLYTSMTSNYTVSAKKVPLYFRL